MNKTDLILSLATQLNMSKTHVKACIEGFLQSLQTHLRHEKRIALSGVGIFTCVKREKRTGRNPRTGKSLTLPAKNAIRFKPSKQWSRMVNS